MVKNIDLSINEFSSELLNGNTSNSSLFKILVGVPKGMSYNYNDSRELSFRIESTEMPGRNVDTFDSGGNSHGPRKSIAYGQSLTDITLTIILSEDLRERDFFSEWQDIAIGNYRTDGNLSGTSDVYEIGFYDDYISDIKILKLNNRGDVVHNVKLVEAYPVTIGALQLSWDNDSIQRMDITFTYRNYIENKDDN